MKDYTKEAKKLLPKKEKAERDCQGYLECYADGKNGTIDDCKPVVIKLLKEIDKLKELNKCYTCGSIDEAPRYCIECYSKLEKQIDKLKEEI